MPIFLSPVLLFQTAPSSCAYCLLLVPLMWLCNSAPKPAVALLHAVDLPLLSVMSVEELFTHFLSLDALLIVLLLYLVGLVDTLTDLVKRTTYHCCRRYGARRKDVFVSLCASCFLAAMLVSTSVLCVPLLCLVDRVFSVMYKEDMDQETGDTPPTTSQPSFLQGLVGSVSSPSTDTASTTKRLLKKLAAKTKLFKLASRALKAKKPSRQKVHIEDENRLAASGPASTKYPGMDKLKENAAKPNEAQITPNKDDKPTECSEDADEEIKMPTTSRGDGKQHAATEDKPSPDPVPSAMMNSKRRHSAVDDERSRQTEKRPSLKGNAKRNAEANDKSQASQNDKNEPAGNAERFVVSDDNSPKNQVAPTKSDHNKDEAESARNRLNDRSTDGGKDAGKEVAWPTPTPSKKGKSKKTGGHRRSGHGEKGAPRAVSNPGGISRFPVTSESLPGTSGGVDTSVAPTGTTTEAVDNTTHSRKKGSHKKSRKGRKKENQKALDAKPVTQSASQVTSFSPSPYTEKCKVPVDEVAVAAAHSGSPKPLLEGAVVSKRLPPVLSGTQSPSDPPENPAESAAPRVSKGGETSTGRRLKSKGPTKHAMFATEENGDASSGSIHSTNSPVATEPAFADRAHRRASILRLPDAGPRVSITGRPKGARVSVGFGADEYASFEPTAVAEKPLFRTTAVMRIGSPAVEDKTRRRLSSIRLSSRDGWEGIPEPPSVELLNQEEMNKERQMKRRADIHNAFLLGPSLVITLGHVCSYWAGPAFDALKQLEKTASLEAKMTASSWCVMTLPGSMVSLAICCLYLSWSHLLPHEPDLLQQTAVVEGARTKLKELGPQSHACAAVVHTAIFVLVMCVPAGFIGADVRLTLLTLLTWTALLVSALTSMFPKTPLSVRQCLCQIPWGVVFVFGAVQVTTKVVEAYSLLPGLFGLLAPSFWERRSPVEVQAILATISSVLAEATNNRTLSILMMPIVQDIAEAKNMYPLYYAIPVVVGATSNVIMPVSIPMVVVHEIGRVPMSKLLVLGLALKTVLVGMVILTVNAIGKTLYDWGHQQAHFSS